MKNKKIIILLVLLIICVPFLIYLANFNIMAFDEDFYKKEFLKYDVYSRLSNEYVDNINDQINAAERADNEPGYEKLTGHERGLISGSI